MTETDDEFVVELEVPGTEHLKAVFTKGVLEVHAHKLHAARTKKVEIAKE